MVFDQLAHAAARSPNGPRAAWAILCMGAWLCYEARCDSRIALLWEGSSRAQRCGVDGWVYVCMYVWKNGSEADRPGSPRMGWKWDPGDWYLEEGRKDCCCCC